jgi:glycosyltransferase involved in cell wall biosynthesis
MIAGSALVCTYGVPQFDRDSGSRRIKSHVEFLAEAGWHVDFFAVNGVGPERYARALQQSGVAVYEPESASFEELILSGSYDLVLFAFWQTAELYAPTVRRLLPDCRIVVDSIDLQLLRDARRRFSEHPARLLGMDYASEVVGELNVYAAADGVLTVSLKEADIVNDLVCDQRHAFAIPDCEDLSRSPQSFAQREGIVFIGSFHHPPNASAMEFLCDEVLPLVDPELLSRHPASIVGAGLEAIVASNTPNLSSVRMVGWVPSVIPYLERARVSVVPLLYGAGTKRKLLQALMVGTPTVATSVGTEGLALEHGDHVLVAEEAAAFARSIERLLVDRALWSRISRKGSRHIRSTHGREVVRKAFLQSIRTILARPPRAAMLPEPTEEAYLQRLRYQLHQKFAPRIAEIIDQHLPRGSTVAVLGEGSSELLDFEGRTAVPFPAEGDARPLAWEGDTVPLLEAAKANGADFLLLPITARWRFMGSHPELSEYLARHHTIVAHVEEVCDLYSLAEMPVTRADLPEITVTSEAADRSLTEDEPSVRLIAFYLPQFHPIPENDEWWGEGFTEWTNVARANPLFEGHYQPHVPADFGFYDLRLPETRQAQADLARHYGIAGFCYYHYWFGGKRLLGRPFDEVLTSGEPDFPFCLCWANEPWSRRWDGQNEDVLQPQVYGHEDDVSHIRWLLPALADPRALHVDGRPVFIVYQARDLPDPTRTVDTWRSEVSRAGLPDPYLMTVETGWDEAWDATEVGFDAKVMFRPQFSILRRAPRLAVGNHDLEVRDYQTAWPTLAEPEDVPYPHFETVCPGWDNSPRKNSRGVVLHNSTPDAYEQWLTSVASRAAARDEQYRLVFINAWNEWGEGCHLEPDQRFGHGYLEATRRALAGAGWASASGLPSIRHVGERSLAVAGAKHP